MMISNFLKQDTEMFVVSIQIPYIILISSLMLTIGSCGLLSSDGSSGNEPIDPSAQWQRMEAFKGAKVRYLLTNNNFLYMSVTIDTLERGTPGRARLLRTHNGKEWEVIKEDKSTAGPIFIKGDTLGWLTQQKIHQYDGGRWKIIETTSSFVSTGRDAIIRYKGKWYVSGTPLNSDPTTELWRDGDQRILPVSYSDEKNNGDNWRISGARQFYHYGNKYLGIQGSNRDGFPASDSWQPFIFGVPDARFLGGTMIPPADRVAFAGALQVVDGRILISTQEPGYIREWKDKNWPAITDTIPTIDYKGFFRDRVDNAAQYIEKYKDRLYISTTRSGVMYWSETEERWFRSSEGLPKRQDALEAGMQKWYLNPHYFEIFNGYLYAGYGFNDAFLIKNYDKSISGLYIKQISE